MAINREKLVEAANKFIEKQKYDKAVVELRKIVAADPNDVRTLQKIGDLQLRQSLFADAIDTFESVGGLYTRDGFAIKAIAVYKQVREIIAKHAPHLAERYDHIAPKIAGLYQETGLVAEALAVFSEVAARLQRQQKTAEATEVCRTIAALDAENPLAHLRLAEALSGARDVDGAFAAFAAAASLLTASGRRDDAIHVIERLLQHKADPAHARVCAELYLARNRPQDVPQALAKLQICFQANPRDVDALSLIAHSFHMLGQTAKAVEVQKEVARIARETGRTDLFRQVVATLIRVAPNDEGVRQLARQ